jgi:hypothetical protein
VGHLHLHVNNAKMPFDWTVGGGRWTRSMRKGIWLR